MSSKQLDEIARTWILQRSLTLAKTINMTTMDAIRKALAEGYDQGETITQLAKRIEGYFEGNAQARARMTARTETIAANNAGAQDRYAKEGIEEKEWLSAPDARPSHQDANGQIVGINDNFKVGDGYGPGPGQIGIPEEDINCRCQILPVIK